MSYYYPSHLHFTTAAGTDGETSIAFHERMEVVAVKVVDFDGIAADATNYATFQVLGKDKATVLFQWATLNTAQGALTANVSADLVSQNNQAKAVFEAGDVLIVKVVKAASGKATKASVCLQLRQARSY